MRVPEARFLGAAAKPGQEPRESQPEVAFAGRSNVGKSSLINCVVGVRGLARTSGTPGRTRQMNFFAIGEDAVFVDLPGYGFAVGPEAERRSWGPLVETYLRERTVLKGVIMIVDLRRGVEVEETQLLEFLVHHGRPALVVGTKVDKLGGNQARAAVAALERQLPPETPVVAFSARTGVGRDAVWRVIRGWVAVPRRGR